MSSQLVKAVAGGRYVAIVQGYSGAGQLTLLDDHTGRQQVLSPPNCPGLNDSATELLFGGPWLLVECGYPSYSYILYNLGSGQWSPFVVSSQCQGNCHPVAIGRYWIKIQTDEGIMDPDHAPTDYYLQNISTGEFERDPARPGGTVLDDLNAPSGSSRLCAPLRYPAAPESHGGGSVLGSISFYGRFAWTYVEAYRLRRCGSKLNLLVYNGVRYTGSYYLNQPLASSRAVIFTLDGKTLQGRFLPSLRQFRITRPPCLPVIPGPQSNGLILVALSDRRVYVRPVCGGDQLWATTLLSARRHS